MILQCKAGVGTGKVAQRERLGQVNDRAPPAANYPVAISCTKALAPNLRHE
jgi:hypothetical protein